MVGSTLWNVHEEGGQEGAGMHRWHSEALDQKEEAVRKTSGEEKVSEGYSAVFALKGTFSF